MIACNYYKRRTITKIFLYLCHWYVTFMFKIFNVALFDWLTIEVQGDELNELFAKKLQQCCYCFDFMDPVSDLRNKEIKRAALNDLIDCISSGRKVIIESTYSDVVKLVSLILVYLERFYVYRRGFHCFSCSNWVDMRAEEY